MTGLFCFISVAVVNVLTLHVLGRLDLIIMGALIRRFFLGSVVWRVMSQLNTIIATMGNMMIVSWSFLLG
jgi:hypothetical protein